ncbi:MAG: TldD/PmbA family protein [Polyangiaceae bacterium]|nr:TldD/PmbA family protein [Polyangiaceae bacterium]
MTGPTSPSLVALAERVVEHARRAGADVAEATAGSGWELTARVRLGQTELLEEAGTRSVALRVFRGQRAAVTATSDVSDAGLERLVADALALAELTEPDPYAGPADPALLARPPFPELDLYDPAVGEVGADRAIELARRAEAAAMAHDPRLRLSEGATFSRSTGERALVLSSGFVGVSRGSSASITVTPVVEDEGGKKRRGFHWASRRHLSALEEPEAVGVEAARRTLAKLGARRVPTTQAAVVFDADIARSVLGTLAGCLLGGALWRRSSYLLDRVGTEVASPLVTVIDDPLVPRGPGSRAFDGEGLASRRNLVIEAGVLRTYLLDAYAARKLGLAPTGSAARGGGTPSATTSNFVLQPGALSRAALLASTARGLLVTEMMGFGFNAVTGDFSRGASGFWIEDGRVVQPVSEVTISSNLDTMLRSIDAVADDLDTRTATASPTFRVATMTIAGGDA